MSEQLRRRANDLVATRESLNEGVLSRDLLLQAKALILCGLPYRRTDQIRVTRTARIGRAATMSVTFAAVAEGSVLPYGADRAVLGWIQTRAYRDGFIHFSTLREFLDAFGLSDCGRSYRRFRERVERLSALSLRVELKDEADPDRPMVFVNGHPIRRGYYPTKSGSTLKEEASGQTLLIPRRYGFELDPEFWAYLRDNPVPLPLPLMRLFHSRPKGWDFAQFLLYRCFAARRAGVVPWKDFRDQLGSLDSNARQLRYTLKKYLEEIRVIYPDLPVEVLHGEQGLSVGPWRPPGFQDRRWRNHLADG